MNSEENSPKLFRKMLKEKLVPYMESINYRLSYDNDLLDDTDRASWVFKLVFQGLKTVEISNDDWRDYTEYFNCYVNSKLVFTINIHEQAGVEEAYELCRKKLEDHLRK